MTLQPPHRITPTLLTGLFIFAATLGVYARTAGFSFIVFDDPGYVYENAHVRTGLTWDNVQWAFVSRERANWHPITWLSHMVDAQCYGMRAGGHHLTSAILHAVNALLVFLWLRQATSNVYASGFAGLIFGLHPLHVESVAWISERKDVLCAFFFLGALMAYTRFAAQRRWRAFVFATVFFVLALLSKPMAVTLPFVALLADVWPLQRFTRATALRCLVEKAPWLILSAISCAITIAVQSAGNAVRTTDSAPLQLRCENALISYVRYLVQTFLPIHLVPFYPYPRAYYPVSLIVCAVFVLLFVSILAVASLRRAPFVFAGWFWFIGMLVPVIGIVQVGGQSMADRYMYLPSIGLFFAIIWTMDAAIMRNTKKAPVVLSAGAVAVVALAVTTWHQLGYWRNSVLLFQRTVKVADSPEARTLLGYSYQLRHEWEHAQAQYARALELDPRQVIAQNNIASIAVEQKRWPDAAREANRAIAIDPAHAAAYVNLGAALEGQGRVEEAAAQYLNAARIQPGLVDAYEKLGALLIRLEHFDGAIDAYRTAVQLAPDHVDDWTNLAIALSGAKRYAEAGPLFLHALELAPGNSGARYSYAYMLYVSGKYSQAELELVTLLTQHPEDADAKALLRDVRAPHPGAK